MNPLARQQLIRQIHAQRTPMVLAVTGGGSGAIAELLQVPGASHTLLEAVIPYSQAALVDWLGSQPEQFCADRTARAMAMVAFLRAKSLAADQSLPIAGIACTASLASDRPKRGPHRAYIALQTAGVTAVWHLQLLSSRDREEEERLVASAVLHAVARAAGIDRQHELELAEGELFSLQQIAAPPTWSDLLLGRLKMVLRTDSTDARTEPVRGAVVYPGAFNPLHEGHLGMAELATRRFGRPVEFEISVVNVDKPPLDFLEIATRLRQFTPQQPVWLTRLPTFVEKAQAFPQATFLVGADTITRIGEARYYHDDPVARDTALATIALCGCRFLVFGRLTTGTFRTLDELDLPPFLRSLCDEVPSCDFRCDISSTQLRATKEA